MVRKVTPKKLFAVLLIIVLQGTSLPVVVLAQEASDAAALQMETREDVLPGLDVASHMPATDSAGVDPVLSPVLSDDQAHDEAVLPAFTNADTADSYEVVRKIKWVRSLS